ncbi:hypothetical protein ACR2R6_11910 [Methylocaldum gracile subsp. desertum]|uniref:hypothetical protein n=1 Tax=Methylocaldum sp. GT1BW TaxID=3438964 RepID=UPI003DA0A586
MRDSQTMSQIGMREYPLFKVPDPLGGRSPKEWKPKEAEQFCEWIKTVGMEERVAGLLEFFGESMEGAPEEVLERLGRKAAETLKEAIYWEEGSDTWKEFVDRGIIVKRKTLTHHGAALGRDIGLLIAKLLLDLHPHVHWDWVRKPKSDVDYHQPKLVGYDPIHGFAPMRMGMGCAGAVANSKDDFLCWRRTFEKMNHLMAKPV